MGFLEHIAHLQWAEVKSSIADKTTQDVETALAKEKRDLEDFKALISCAAEPYLEQMAQLSNSLTKNRFGKTIQMYIPLYISNECTNICTYCGFSAEIDITRKILSAEEIIAEATVIKSLGYDHLLIVTGESNKFAGVEYLLNALQLLRGYFSHIAMEVQPLKHTEYELLIKAGLNTVLLYQETYCRQSYRNYHRKGKKANYEYRLDTHDRIGKAGIYKRGLGVLLGLEDWRTDSFFCAAHLAYLEKTYWQSKYSISFPRIRPCAAEIEIKSPVTDRELVQLICAYRLFNEEVELSLSTREAPDFRDHAIQLGITSVSAESKTEPGGYCTPKTALQQFAINDDRSTKEVARAIRQYGYEPIFKDWDRALFHP